MSPFLFRIVDKLLILLKECGYQARPFANDLAVWGGSPGSKNKIEEWARHYGLSLNKEKLEIF